MIRIALAGLGVHGARYARHLLAGDVCGATLAAVCRSDLARGREFAARHGVAVEPDVGSLARRPDVDAVVLALRPDLTSTRDRPKRRSPRASRCWSKNRSHTPRPRPVGSRPSTPAAHD